MSGVVVGRGRGLGGYPPGVYVPLKALFLVCFFFCTSLICTIEIRSYFLGSKQQLFL